MLEKELLAFETGRARLSRTGTSAKQAALQRAVKEQQRSIQATNMGKAKAEQDASELKERCQNPLCLLRLVPIPSALPSSLPPIQHLPLDFVILETLPHSLAKPFKPALSCCCFTCV